MRSVDSRGIIAKYGILPIGIFFLALVLRVFRIDTLTEFLGDQGRTLLIMDKWVSLGQIPLAGPTTLSGDHLGPIFYYVLLPGYVLAGAFGTALWVALLGALSVIVLFTLARDLYSERVAQLISLLWAVSPLIIRSDRVIWEPNLVPLFVLVFLVCFVRAHRHGEARWWFACGALTGILLQLHYPNILFVGLVGLYGLFGLISKTLTVQTLIRSVVWFVLGMTILLVPFLIYEFGVGFKDVLGIGNIFVQGGGDPVGKRVMLSLFIDYLGRVSGRMLPFLSPVLCVGLLSLWGIFVLVKGRRLFMFLTLWLVVGLGAMARYPGVVYDHYLYFLIPVPFLMLGAVLHSVKTVPVALSATMFIVVLSGIQLMRTDIFSVPNPDISRVGMVTKFIQDDVGKAPFSFTLINSPSYTDLHYRYFFTRMNMQPDAITGSSFNLLYVICDGSDCPSAAELTAKKELAVMCYDEHCSGQYPTIQLAFWQYDRLQTLRRTNGAEATIFRFSRRPLARHGGTLVNLVQ